MGAEGILMRAWMPNSHLQEHQGIWFFWLKVLIQCLFSPLTTWQEQKVLPPLPTSSLTLMGNPLTSAERLTNFTPGYGWTVLQMGRCSWGRNSGCFCSCPEDLVDPRQVERAFRIILSIPLPLGRTAVKPLYIARTSPDSYMLFMYSVARIGNISSYQPTGKSSKYSLSSWSFRYVFTDIALLLYNNSDDNPSLHLYVTLHFKYLCVLVSSTVKWENITEYTS